MSAGYFGKLPAVGDFVSQGLDGELLRPWQEWMQTCIAISQAQLQSKWLDYYIVSPVWRFALSPGICGGSAVAGVWIPSIDKVGRYYPLTMAAPINATAANLLVTGSAWYDAAADLLVTTLNPEFEFSELGSRCMQLPELQNYPAANAQHELQHNPRGTAYCGVHNAASDLLHLSLTQQYPRYSLWWTEGSDLLMPCCLIATGLPAASGFAAFLDGNWENWGLGAHPL
jgi:type VI secretion system protein ImpM